MRLDRLSLKNYRRYADATFSFGPRFNVIVGVNGSGKTSLLSGVHEALNAMFLGSGLPALNPLAEGGAGRIERVSINDRTRFEPCFPVVVAAYGEILGQMTSWAITKNAGDSVGTLTNEAFAIGQRIKAQFDVLLNGAPLPMLAYYRANRRWAHVAASTLNAATARESRVDGYKNWLDASVDSNSLQLWAIAKCLERLQASSENGDSFGSVSGDDLSVLDSALSHVVEGASGLRYDMKSRTLYVQWIDRLPTPFENLSDGQRSAVSLVADIVRRVCLLNPQLGRDAAALTDGIVLIDELDMHLHPAWQRMMVKGLKTTFPRIQFIAASHSPQILSEVEPDEILILDREGMMHPRNSYGMDSNRILEEIMDAPSRPTIVQDQLDELFELLDTGRLAEAKELIASIRAVAPGVSEIARAEALLKRKETIGR
jgi:predicted ATP-binding protein involved in virulence